MILSETYANNYLSFLLGKTKTLTAPTTVYIGLCTNNPEIADGDFAIGDFNEIVGDTYERVVLVINGESYPNLIGAAADKKIVNIAQINWTKTLEGYPDAKGFGLFSMKTDGTPFAMGKLANTLTTPAGAVALFEAGGLEFFIGNAVAE